MADILIRMEMPKTCSQCPMCYDYMMCKLNHFAFWNTNEPFDCCDDRLAGCPLHELPEHGDLVEAKSVCDTIDRFLGYLDEDMIFRIKYKLSQDCPVIVPSNKDDLHTMDEFMCGQECGNPEDGSL